MDSVPHIRYLDLAIIFCCRTSDKDPTKTSVITKRGLEELGLSLSELEQLASRNTPRLRPASFDRLEELLEQLGEGMMLPPLPEEQSVPMFVLSNEEKYMGACTILYPGFLRGLCRCFGENVYILPSSIHECILIPEEEADRPWELREIVREINATQIPEEEFLSDQIYYYDRGDDTICIWDREQKQEKNSLPGS